MAAQQRVHHQKRDAEALAGHDIAAGLLDQRLVGDFGQRVAGGVRLHEIDARLFGGLPDGLDALFPVVHVEARVGNAVGQFQIDVLEARLGDVFDLLFDGHIAHDKIARAGR